MPSQSGSFTERVLAHCERVNAMLKEIRRATAYLRNRQRYAFWMLEEVSGLHKNSLLRLADLEWHPKPDTLLALARLVERAQAHRRGEKFKFPTRRGPGRPKVFEDERPEVPPKRRPSRQVIKAREAVNGGKKLRPRRAKPEPQALAAE